MTIEFSVEKFEDIIEELKPLLQAHWEEVEIYQDKIKLNPDYNKYQIMSDQDMLHMVTARLDGRIVGYYISFIMPHMHYQNHKFAFNDILYLDPTMRKGFTALKLFKYAENSLKEIGVSVITIHTKVDIPFDTLCEYLNYDYAERIYTKYIGVN